MARRGSSVVRLPPDQGHQRADPQSRASDATGGEPTRQSWAQEEAGPQTCQLEGSQDASGHDTQGESLLRVQASLLDREASREFQGRRTRPPEQMIEYMPELAVLRQFADRIY